MNDQGLGENTVQVWLVRHGETLWNRERRFQGHQDIPLSDKGRDEARLCAERLKTQHFDALFSSDLGRASETASIAFEGHGLSITHDQRFRERHMGVLQGHTRDEIPQLFPNAWAAFNENTPDSEVEGGGESIAMVRERLFSALGDIFQTWKGKRVAVVSHGGVARVCVRHLLGIRDDVPSRFPVPNLAVQVFEVEPAACIGLEPIDFPWRLLSLNAFNFR